LVEVDWSSLFSSFFGLIRVKIACKDISKIPKKRLFEMQKNMYVVHFKVEFGSGEAKDNGGPDDGGNDNNDSEFDEELGEDDFDEELGHVEKKTPEQVAGK
jgi:hypothetical protein